MKHFLARAVVTLTLAALPLGLAAQNNFPDEHHPLTWDAHITDCSKQGNHTQMMDCSTALSRTFTHYLQNAVLPNDANEVLVAVRNSFDPSVRIYLVSNQNAIVVTTWPEEYARIEALIKTLDRPHKTFRLNYTFTDFDGDKRVGTQHFSIVAADGQRATLKQGNKIPIATGTSDDKTASAGVQTQFTYLDIGINIDATPGAYADGVHLASKVQESSVTPEPVVIAGISEPIIRQSILESVIDVPSGKPVLVGTIDISGTTHHLDVAVAIDTIP